ncbi:MAG: hypothetical protein AABY15_02995 [Nanoarchaeota archaeon]
MKPLQKKIEKMNAKTIEQNKTFAKMGKMQKRVAIAHDVIASIKANKFKATPGTYCELKLNKKHKFEGAGDVELQSLMESGVVEKCNVCAIGGIFASKVAIGNKFKVSVEEDYWNDNKLGIETDVDDDELLIENLDGIYTERELRLIEFAFEGEDIRGEFYDEEIDIDALNSYKKVHKKADERLIAIMQNIIKNEGKFIPELLKKTATSKKKK